MCKRYNLDCLHSLSLWETLGTSLWADDHYRISCQIWYELDVLVISWFARRLDDTKSQMTFSLPTELKQTDWNNASVESNATPEPFSGFKHMQRLLIYDVCLTCSYAHLPSKSLVMSYQADDR